MPAELAAWKEFQSRLNQFFTLPQVIQDCIDIELIFKGLKSDEANITNLILIELYASATETLSKLKDKAKCPVCDKIFDGDLEKHISEKHKALEALNKKKTDYLDKKKEVLSKLESIAKKLAIIKSEKNEKVLLALKSFFDEIEILDTELTNCLSELKKLLKDTDSLNLSNQAAILMIGSLSEKELENKKIASDKIKSLSEDKISKDLTNDFESIIQLISAFTGYLKNEKKVAYLTTVTEKLDLLFTTLTLAIQTQIQNTFTAIQTDVVDCYNFFRID